MKTGDKVKYLTCKNEISKDTCEVIGEFIEDGVKCFRIKKPNNEIIRLYHDRVIDSTQLPPPPPKAEKKMESQKKAKFDWVALGVTKALKILPESEIWVSNNEFDHKNVQCITIAVLDKTYRTANIYLIDGKTSKITGIMEYDSDIEKVKKKLAKKGYVNEH